MGKAISYKYDQRGNLIFSKSGITGDFNEKNEMMIGSGGLAGYFFPSEYGSLYPQYTYSIKLVDSELNLINEVGVINNEVNTSLTHISPHYFAKSQKVRKDGYHISVSRINFDNLILSVEETQLSQVNVYPNPFSHTVQFTLPAILNCSISVYNAQGQKIKSYEKIPESDDLTDLPNGIYFFRTSNGACVKAVKR